MVYLKIFSGNDHVFSIEALLTSSVDDAQSEVVKIYNHRLKLQRLCDEIGQLAKHGVQVKPEMLGLTPDQIQELKLVDELAISSVPSSGFGEECPDDCGRRCGRPPRVDMQNIFAKTINEAKAAIFKPGKKLTFDMIDEQILNLRGAVMIVYPMGLPPYDHVQCEFENQEEASLAGTQASKSIIKDKGSLWFSTKKLEQGSGKLLNDYLGRNEKSRVVLKLQGEFAQGAPAKQPAMDKEEHKELMMKMYKRQEELKKLHEDAEFDQDSYLDSQWADPNAMKNKLQGLSHIKGL